VTEVTAVRCNREAVTVVTAATVATVVTGRQTVVTHTLNVAPFHFHHSHLITVPPPHSSHALNVAPFHFHNSDHALSVAAIRFHNTHLTLSPQLSPLPPLWRQSVVTVVVVLAAVTVVTVPTAVAGDSGDSVTVLTAVTCDSGDVVAYGDSGMVTVRDISPRFVASVIMRRPHAFTHYRSYNHSTTFVTVVMW
jgi:hypothetical protein